MIPLGEPVLPGVFALDLIESVKFSDYIPPIFLLFYVLQLKMHQSGSLLLF